MYEIYCGMRGSVLGSKRMCIAYDARDKIHGVLALASDEADYEAPDYHKSVEEVYTKFAKHDFGQNAISSRYASHRSWTTQAAA